MHNWNSKILLKNYINYYTSVKVCKNTKTSKTAANNGKIIHWIINVAKNVINLTLHFFFKTIWSLIYVCNLGNLLGRAF